MIIMVVGRGRRWRVPVNRSPSVSRGKEKRGKRAKRKKKREWIRGFPPTFGSENNTGKYVFPGKSCASDSAEDSGPIGTSSKAVGWRSEEGARGERAGKRKNEGEEKKQRQKP